MNCLSSILHYIDEPLFSTFSVNLIRGHSFSSTDIWYRDRYQDQDYNYEVHEVNEDEDKGKDDQRVVIETEVTRMIETYSGSSGRSPSVMKRLTFILPSKLLSK